MPNAIRPRAHTHRAVRHVPVLLCLAAALCACGSTPPPRYNVLLVSLDTVRQDVLGCYGRRPRHAPELSPTPALDRLAGEGVRMADAYAPSSGPCRRTSRS